MQAYLHLFADVGRCFVVVVFDLVCWLVFAVKGGDGKHGSDGNSRRIEGSTAVPAVSLGATCHQPRYEWEVNR